MSTPTATSPSQEEVEDFLLSCRYGELEDVQAFVEKFGDEALESARDDRGNSAVHMFCGNGHSGMSLDSMRKTELTIKDVLKYLLPRLSASILSATNENGSPPLHWAILNNHVAIVQLLIEVPEEKGGGTPLLKVSIRTRDGPLSQAEG